MINFAIKIKPLFYSNTKKGLDYNLEYSSALKSMVAYLHDCYVNQGLDESNEQWIYEKSLWFDDKGKVRRKSDSFAVIKSKVKYPDILIDFE